MRFYLALWRGDIAGWPLQRFEDATGLKLTWEGSLKEDLPPMPRFLNRLLALPIDEQNQLFAELEDRIAAGIEQAMEAGTYEVGVETVRADSLAAAGRETLYTHPGSGAATELVEIVRRDRLEPTTADAALEIGKDTHGGPTLVVNARSNRAAVVLPAPSGLFDDGGVQERVRLLRPAGRDTMAKAELDASNWRKRRRRRTGGRSGRTRSPVCRRIKRIAVLARGRPAAAGLGPSAGREHAGAASSGPTHGEALIGARARFRAGPRRAFAAFGLGGGPRHDRRRGLRGCHGTRRGARARQRLAARTGAASWAPTEWRSRDPSIPTPRSSSAWAARSRSSRGARAIFAPGPDLLERVIQRWPLAA